MLLGQQELSFTKYDFQSKEDAIQALIESESRFQAIVSNISGLIFQFQLSIDAEINFAYLSAGCKTLLGFNPETLKQDSNQFYEMINVKDRATLSKRIEASASRLKILNWVGRVWIDRWPSNKWINMRATPRVLNDGTIQWEGIMTDITQSKNEKHGFEKSRRSIAELSAHMDQIKEHERSRIAREIHDDLGGNLTAIKIGLSSIINKISADQKVSLEQAQNLESILDSTFDAIHRISSDLRPSILDLGIVAAVEWQVTQFEKQLGIKCRFSCRQSDIPVTTDQAITLFRICQESMSNIAKHAKASSVHIDLNSTHNEIVMTISDNGVGIKPSDTLKANSFGLRGMQERVTSLRGSFEIAESNEPGTIVTITLPIERENDFF
jgi:signal transduction histidine kinase